MDLKTEVLIIGGGATGAGIARDLALRGIPSLPEDGVEYRADFIRACESAGINTLPLSPREALKLEPRLNPRIIGAVQVPDGAVDPFTLVVENIRDAEARGTRVFTYTEVVGLITDGGGITGALVHDLINGEKFAIAAAWVINATGAWANTILKMAGISIPMALSKGSMLITNTRLSERVLNRCRPPASGDIIVPNSTVSIIGTTSLRVKNIEDHDVKPEEAALLVDELSRMVPEIRQERFTRAYAGVRPLIGSGETDDDRSISRGFSLIDHKKDNGVPGLITIAGGKLITYRLMAEKTVDFICERMGLHVACTTHYQRLPGAGIGHSLQDRLLNMGRHIPSARQEIICDCELVPRDEVEAVLKEGKVRALPDILHRTRIAKGTCQGGFCVYRLLGMLNELRRKEGGGDSNEILKGFLEERWKGIKPVLWGVSLKEEELIESIYKGLFNL